MQLYCESLTRYQRLTTREVKVGNLLLGNHHPIRLQTMTTTDTMNTQATVEQSIRCIEAGAELVRITAPSKKEAENLLNIRNDLHRRGYFTPLVADIHFTPNAAEIAARIVEKVRVNPGNYVDKKRFEQIEYTDAEYLEEIDRIRERFTPLVKICKEYGTAMRIGTNHGSLSDRIMSRYGDTAIGMVESAMEFLRIARAESYHNIVLSMKSSNPQVMVQAYRLLLHQMDGEFNECYPLHLGVTEAGDGEDGRVKSAAGIGTLLEDGIGDTIRVSLTEDPELEIPVCRDLVKRYKASPTPPKEGLLYAEAQMNSSQSVSQSLQPTNDTTIQDSEAAKPGLSPSFGGVGEAGRGIEGAVVKASSFHYHTADPMLYDILKNFVKAQRSQPTEAENALWQMLRGKNLQGYKFRRQHIIGPFITDFICLAKKLVIEVDGLIHQLPDNLISDAERTVWLNKQGFKVIRFKNEEVLGNSDEVLKSILRKVIDTQQPISLTNNLIHEVGSYLIPPLGGGGALFSPFEYKRRETFEVTNIGAKHVPVVIADLSKLKQITPQSLQSVGYTYNKVTDKWKISDGATDYIFTGSAELDFALPGTLKVITWPNHWQAATDQQKYFPIYDAGGYVQAVVKSPVLNFVMLDCFSDATPVNDFTFLDELANDPSVVLCLSSKHSQAMMAVRRMCVELLYRNIKNPIVLICDSYWQTPDEHLIHFATETGALLLDGFGDGICLGMTQEAYQTTDNRQRTTDDSYQIMVVKEIVSAQLMTELSSTTLSDDYSGSSIAVEPVVQNRSAIPAQSSSNTSGRNYTINQSVEQFLNTTAFSILQATRTRISKTEYISCPSCGRTLFDLQETTAKIRSVTSHLKGLKIAIMGCIVNGPGEMADADFGYVGSGPGKITLYKGKEVIKRNVPDEVAVEELIQLLKENEAWIEPVQ